MTKMLHYYRHQARMCIYQCLITLHQILTDHLQTKKTLFSFCTTKMKYQLP